MSNLVNRLRNLKYNATPEEIFSDCNEAADRIEELEDEVERLKTERRTLPEYDDAISAISKENERLEAENEKLREALQSIVMDVSSQRQKYESIEELEAQVEALQNKCARRGLSPEDSDALEDENERLREELGDIASCYIESPYSDFDDGINYVARQARKALTGDDDG